MISKRELNFSLPFRALRGIIRRKYHYSGLKVNFTGSEANALITNALQSSSPVLIGRFGSCETNTAVTFLNKNSSNILKKIYYIAYGGNFFFDEHIKYTMENNAGFFPTDNQSLARFSQILLDATKNIDVLASLYFADKIMIEETQKNVPLINFTSLEPYYYDDPWSYELKGKKILVVSPFSKTIRMQYYNRKEKIFLNKKVLPDFDLLTFQAVQTNAGNSKNCKFDTWFHALDYMKNGIANIDFDIALLSAGSYGMPLASYIKSLGKKAIYMGGALQLLFGIKGKRWDSNPFYMNLYNENWVRPSKDEIPINANNVEDGCYW